VDRLDAGMAVALTAALFLAAASALALGHQLAAVLLATLTTVCVTAITRPRAYRLLAIGWILAVPFITAVPALHPQDYDYFLYAGAFSLLLVGLGVFQPDPIPVRLGTAFLTYTVVAAAIALSLALTPADTIRALSSPVAALGVYVLVLRGDRSERRLFVGGLLALASVESVIAILQAFTGWPVFSIVLPSLFEYDRNYLAYLVPGMSSTVTLGSGTFYHFNLLGSVLALAAPVAFALWLQIPRSWPRFVLFALLGGGALATFSRGTLLALTLAIALLLLTEYTRGRRQGTIVLLSAVAIAAMLAYNVFTRYVEATGNITTRWSTWLYAVDNALETPSNLLFGYGFRYFQRGVLSAGDVNRAIHSDVLTHLHSGALQLLLEFGIIGLVLFILWIASTSLRSRVCFDSFLVRGLVAATLGFFVYQMVENILFAYPGVLFAAVVACLEAECADMERFRPTSAQVAQSLTQGPDRESLAADESRD
jgi:hypothetical protein